MILSRITSSNLRVGQSVVQWTNTQGEFCRMWQSDTHFTARSNAGWRYLVGQTAADGSCCGLVNARRVLLEFFHPDGRSVLTYVMSPLVSVAIFQPVALLSTRHNECVSHFRCRWRDEVSAAAGLQRACETIGRVLVCAGTSTMSTTVFSW